MKKTLSMLLSALTLVSAMTACAPEQDRLDPAITLASSAARANAEWLDTRLDTIPDDVIIGIGSNGSYDIDMSGFEDDGYIARAMGGEVLLFGKTEEGLDRAVREYAKAADIGATAELNTVYHEGERIKKLTVAGNDISGYTVVFNYDRDPYQTSGRGTMTMGNAKLAADELVRLIEVATGITLPTSAEDVDGPMFKIDYVTDDSLGTNGFTYKVEKGNVYLNGAMKAHGCVNGVYYFLEKEIGWEGLTYGDSELIAADLVEVPEGTEATVDPMFDFFLQHQIYRTIDRHDNERSDYVKNFLGYIDNANHGMDTKRWSGKSCYYYQLCYTDESNYMSTLDSVYTYVYNQVEVHGKVIGEDFTTIDISQGDNLNYCTCKECLKVYKVENKAHAGAVVRFANRLAEEMEAEGLGGLVYQIFAYHGSNKPCITAPRSDVYITFCSDGACIMHPMDGSECYGESFDMAGMVEGMVSLNNSDYAEWIKGWDEMTEDNLMIWHYALDNSFGQYTYFKNFYSDIMFLHENGVKGMYFQSGTYGLGLHRLRAALLGVLQYNPDMTEAEYAVAMEKVMQSEYGDGWDFVKDFIGIWQSIESNNKCFNCWGYGDKLNLNNYDLELYSARADEMYNILERARLLANTEAQELRVQRLMLEVAYRQCITSFYEAYDSGDTETLAYLEERYAKFKEFSVNNSYNLNSFSGGYGSYWQMGETLEEEMLVNLADYREELTPEKVGGQYKHVVIIGVDGAGNAWDDAYTPAMDEIFADAATTQYCQNVTPNVSAPNWSTLLTGVVPQIHGVDNAIAGSQDYTKDDYPTFFKLAREAHPDATLAYVGSWGSFDGGMIEPNINLDSVSARGDAAVKDAAIKYLERNTPELMFIYLGDTDHVGHDHGCKSDAYLDCLSLVDDYIGQIYDALVENGMIEDTLFIVTADHGHTTRGGHGGLTDDEKYLFLGVAGKTVIPNDDVKMYSRDLPAIVCHALGIPGNKANWDAYLPAGMFEDAPDGEIRDYNSTVGHKTVPTPTANKALANYVDTSKLNTAIYFDGSLANTYGDNEATADGDITYEDGFYGSAAKLSETASISFEDLKFGTDSFTIGLWLKTDVSYFESPVLYGNKVNGTNTEDGFLFAYHSDSWFNVGDSSQSKGMRVAMGLPDDYDKDNWHHTLLVVDREAGTLGMYYNFKLLREYELDDFLDGVSFDSAYPFTIGEDAAGDAGITTLVDDLLIFDGALNEGEIESLSEYYFG